MISRTERLQLLKPRDPWFGVTHQEAQIAQLREAQHKTLAEKLQWLDQARKQAASTKPSPTTIKP